MAILISPLVAAVLAAATPAAISPILPFPVAQETAGDEDPPIPECPAGTEQISATGLKYCVLKEGGDGEHPTKGDRVKVHYTGWNLDGSVFDSSRKARFPGAPVEPAVFAVGGVIEGWNQALEMMSPGDQWRVYIPSNLAYGERGAPPDIQPNADLIFEIEMLEILERAPKFVAWDAEAEDITTLENGMMYRILEAGEGLSANEADLAIVGFGVFNPGGGLAFAHTMSQSGSKMPMKPGRPPLPFMGELMQHMKAGAKIQANLPSTIGIGANAQIPELPQGSNEIWVFEVDSVERFEKPAFVMPTDEELTTTESGLKYKILKPGTGRQPTAANTVVAHYSGWLTDGTPFDSSYDRGEPTSFPLRGVIAGWTEGLQLIQEGGEIILVCPADIAYGASGRPPTIPGGATLVFFVKLVGVQ
ncbi:putative FKBP-type peptidyl-prolyl cis-trans isomerase FkpA precursor [Planctomycetes bacterium Poly30]|uniref:peptidylprolyl isomerase n=1 Tax=Saltatorellus ferox TaxID=2528018 RepID=A0A518EX97_9BACT|nr:putative FKBP-type peptidyl-prolyl cis-trans isomerase FkpA precursor [Planctomycetes bacterium Poly30]